jgi:glycosyltransferase involved in cell wall biosynthesis
LFLSWIKRVPFLFEVRDLWPDSAVDAGVLHNKYLISASLWLEKKIYEKALAIAVLTPAFTTVLTRRKRVPETKIILATNAADFELAERASTSVDIDKFRKKEGFANRFTVVYVGAHGPVNDLQTVLRAAEHLQNSTIHFLFIGDGMERANLVRIASEKGLKNVRFIGFLDKKSVFQYILAADAGLSILTKSDTFKTVYSNKTFDYFSCRKPVLMAIDGASRTLIEQANAGVYVEPENALDLARKILTYVNNPSLATTQGENGYIYAQSHFNREVLALQYLKEISSRLPFLDSTTV